MAKSNSSRNLIPLPAQNESRLDVFAAIFAPVLSCGLILKRRANMPSFLYTAETEFPRARASAKYASTAISTVGSVSSGVASATVEIGVYSSGLTVEPTRSHNIARSRAAAISRAFSGGRNLAVDRRIRFPFRVPMIRMGQLAPLPAHDRWSHSGRVQGA